MTTKSLTFLNVDVQDHIKRGRQEEVEVRAPEYFFFGRNSNISFHKEAVGPP